MFVLTPHIRCNLRIRLTRYLNGFRCDGLAVRSLLALDRVFDGEDVLALAVRKLVVPTGATRAFLRPEQQRIYLEDRSETEQARYCFCLCGLVLSWRLFRGSTPNSVINLLCINFTMPSQRSHTARSPQTHFAQVSTLVLSPSRQNSPSVCTSGKGQ